MCLYKVTMKSKQHYEKVNHKHFINPVRAISSNNIQKFSDDSNVDLFHTHHLFHTYKHSLTSTQFSDRIFVWEWTLLCSTPVSIWSKTNRDCCMPYHSRNENMVSDYFNYFASVTGRGGSI